MGGRGKDTSSIVLLNLVLLLVFIISLVFLLLLECGFTEAAEKRPRQPLCLLVSTLGCQRVGCLINFGKLGEIRTAPP